MLPVSTPSFCDGFDQCGRTGLKSRCRPFNGRSHCLNLVSDHVAVVLRLGIRQSALGRGHLFVKLRQAGTHDLGAILDGTHIGFRSIKPGIGGTGHCQLFGRGALFFKFLSERLNRAASFCRAASLSFNTLSKRSTGPSSRLKNAMESPRALQ